MRNLIVACAVLFSGSAIAAEPAAKDVWLQGIYHHNYQEKGPAFVSQGVVWRIHWKKDVSKNWIAKWGPENDGKLKFTGVLASSPATYEANGSEMQIVGLTTDHIKDQSPDQKESLIATVSGTITEREKVLYLEVTPTLVFPLEIELTKDDWEAKARQLLNKPASVSGEFRSEKSKSRLVVNGVRPAK